MAMSSFHVLTSCGAADERRIKSNDVTQLSRLVATAFDVPITRLTATTRCRAPVARARQTAMYLAHVVFGLTFAEAGRLYGRDRTTAAHACRLIEDLRDDARFDAFLSVLEQSLNADLSRGASRSGTR